MDKERQAESREYTHKIEFRYRENMNRREYIPEDAVLTPEQEAKTIWSQLEFSLNPLLCDSFLDGICLEDRLKIIKAANPRELWLYARLHHLEVTANAVKPCRAGTDLVEIADRTVILKKHIAFLKQQSELKAEIPRKPYCMVVNDDRVPTLPVFECSDQEMLQFLKRCFVVENHGNDDNNALVVPKNTAGIPVPNPWNVAMKQRNFVNTYRWRDRCDIVPYMLLPRIVWNCLDTHNWCGIYNSSKNYKQNDVVSHDMLYYVALQTSHYYTLDISIDSRVEAIEAAYLAKLIQQGNTSNNNNHNHESIEINSAYDTLINEASRKKYDEQVTNLQNSKFWQLLKQKSTHLLQVLCVVPVEVHNRIYGAPTSKGDGPDLFKISNIDYYDTPETFYLSSSNLYRLLQPELPGIKKKQAQFKQHENTPNNNESMDSKISSEMIPREEEVQTPVPIKPKRKAVEKEPKIPRKRGRKPKTATLPLQSMNNDPHSISQE